MLFTPFEATEYAEGSREPLRVLSETVLERDLPMNWNLAAVWSGDGKGAGLEAGRPARRLLQ